MIMLLYIFIGFLLLFVILVSIAPKSFHVERSIVVKKPLKETFDFLKYTKNQDHWSPWKKKDPNMKQSFVGTDGEVGFISRWEGNKEVGTGEQEIIRIVENDTVENKLRFFKPWKSESTGYLSVEPITENETRVLWGFKGESKPPTNVFFLFFNMDKSVGKDFEEGLNDLKKYLESK